MLANVLFTFHQMIHTNTGPFSQNAVFAALFRLCEIFPLIFSRVKRYTAVIGLQMCVGRWFQRLPAQIFVPLQ